MESDKDEVRVWNWMIRDNVTGKMRKSRWKMGDEQGAKYPGAIKLENTLEVYRSVGDTSSVHPAAHRPKK